MLSKEQMDNSKKLQKNNSYTPNQTYYYYNSYQKDSDYTALKKIFDNFGVEYEEYKNNKDNSSDTTYTTILANGFTFFFLEEKQRKESLDLSNDGGDSPIAKRMKDMYYDYD